MSIKYLLTTLVLIHVGVSISTAETPKTGTITGKVTDAVTGEPMPGATIRIENTKLGAYAKADGAYTIKNVPVGTYSVTVSYVGYEKKTADSVEVMSGKPSKLNFQISTRVSETDAVIVTTERVTDNAGALLKDREQSSVVQDGIGREEMSKLGDGDAGQSMKRVTGVTVVDGKYVYVRGVSDRYSNTTLNGTSLTTTEPDKKSFAFDMFPTELLQNATVSKSFTPDMPGNFVGGLVQLNTIDFPTGFGFKVNFGTGSNDFVTNQNGQFIASPKGATDWLGMDDGSRAMPTNIPANQREFSELLSQVRAGNQEAITEWESIGTGFSNRNWSTENLTAPMNLKGAISFTNLFEIDDNSNVGVVAGVNFNNGYTINRMVRRGVQSNQELLFDYSGQQSSFEAGLSGLFNLAYRSDENNSVSWKNSYNQATENNTVYLYGEDLAQQQLRKNVSFEYVHKNLYSSQLGGEHKITSLNSAVLDWKLGYSESSRNQPDYRRLRYQRNISDLGYDLEAAIPITQQGSGPDAGRFYSDLNEYGRSIAANFMIPTGDVKIKVGALHDFKNRDFQARSFTVIRSSLPDMELDPLLLTSEENIMPNAEALFADTNYTTNRLGISEDSRLRDAYTASESLTAYYAMTEIPFSIAGLDARIIAGARLENSQQLLDSYNDQDQPVNVNVNVSDVLPSINLIVTPQESMNVRLAATQTLSRPSLREFAPFSFYDYSSQSLIRGNPELTRALVQNYDVRWEYFPEPGEVISASVFYKNFKNAIEETIDPAASEIIRSFKNAQGDAQNYGFEVEFRKSLNFISSELNNFSFNANYTWVNSVIEVKQGTLIDKRTMWGQSPYSINMGVYYFNPTSNTAVSMGYNRSGSKIVQVAQVGVFQGTDDPHVYELPRDVIDASIVQNLGGVEIKVAVRDLLNQPLQWQQVGQIVQSNVRGRTFSISFSHKFN